MSTSRAFQPADLPNGTTIKNRIVKAAMEEVLADVDHHCQPSPEIIRLYETWGKGGAGIILSGHVMIDPRGMAAAGDILLAEDAGEFDEQLWRDWISRTQANGSQFWFQINHPGRQVRKGMGLPVYAPSAVQVNLGRLSNVFEKPRELSEAQIEELIQRFAWTAWKAEQLGASGVEIHSAHGYLCSQFLSPRTNLRTDKWGGSLENRARFLFEVTKAIRTKVSPSFGVGIKINTSDFQKGGFGPEDLKWVVEQLNGMGLDFLELSGGSYEVPAMMGTEVPDEESKKAASTKAREAYFLEVAESLEPIAQMPIMVTGGISRLSTLNKVIESSSKLRLAGVGTAMGLMPDLPNRWEKGEDPQPHLTCNTWGLPRVALSLAKITGIQWALYQLGKGRETWPGVWPLFSLIMAGITEQQQTRKYKKWIHELDARPSKPQA